MFTEGLDDNAINWVKQGSVVEQQVRSPLAERVVGDGVMESPLYSTRSFLLSPKVLPPPSLFHSGLLAGVASRTMVGAGLDEEEGGESVASVDMDLGSSDLEEEEEEEEEEELEVSDADDLCDKTSFLRLYNGSRQGLVRGSSKENLRIEVPAVVARKMPDMVSAQSCKFFTPQARFTDARKTPNQMDMGTPSAPPIGDIGRHGLETQGEQWRGEAQEGKDVHTISAPTMQHSRHGSSGVEEERDSLGTSVEGDIHSLKINQMSSR